MRILKFRVWDKTKKRWITDRVALDAEGNAFVILPGNIIVKLDKSHIDVQFYTGLKDRNGKEIYEGDICSGIEEERMDGHLINSFETRGLVKWSDTDGKWILEDWPSGEVFELYDSGAELIIGNIYENPQLLEAQKG